MEEPISISHEKDRNSGFLQLLSHNLNISEQSKERILRILNTQTATTTQIDNISGALNKAVTPENSSAFMDSYKKAKESLHQQFRNDSFMVSVVPDSVWMWTKDGRDMLFSNKNSPQTYIEASKRVMEFIQEIKDKKDEERVNLDGYPTMRSLIQTSGGEAQLYGHLIGQLDSFANKSLENILSLKGKLIPLTVDEWETLSQALAITVGLEPKKNHTKDIGGGVLELNKHMSYGVLLKKVITITDKFAEIINSDGKTEDFESLYNSLHENNELSSLLNFMGLSVPDINEDFENVSEKYKNELEKYICIFFSPLREMAMKPLIITTVSL